MNNNSYRQRVTTTNYQFSNNYQNSKPLPYRAYKYKNYSEDSNNYPREFLNKSSGRIIHRSIQESYNNQDKNRILTKQTIHEFSNSPGVHYIQTPNSIHEKINYQYFPQKNNQNRIINNRNNISFENKKQFDKKYQSSQIVKTKILQKNNNDNIYNSPNIQLSSPRSPIYLNDIQNSLEFDESGLTKKNYKYTKNANTYVKNSNKGYINNRIEQRSYERSVNTSPGNNVIFSPIEYIRNDSSGSDFDDQNGKSFEYFQQRSVQINDNRNNYQNFDYIKKNKTIKKNINYEIEDPENSDYIQSIDRSNVVYVNRSEIRNKINDLTPYNKKDFQSPDRNSQNKIFRNVNIGQIHSKGPTNDDRKVTKVMKKEIINSPNQERFSRISVNSSYNVNLSKLNAAKIIQAWWRGRYDRDQEVYNITVKKAVKLQSFIRGYLVRKKVLRYITLAIYYQSFCDKLQDVLCNNVKKEIFALLKSKFKKINKKKTDIKKKKLTQQIVIQRITKLSTLINKKTQKQKYILSFYINKWKDIINRIKFNTKRNHTILHSKTSTKKSGTKTTKTVTII